MTIKKTKEDSSYSLVFDENNEYERNLKALSGN